MNESKGIGGPRLELEEAVKRLDEQLVSDLLAAGLDPGEKGALNRTALHYAARLGSLEIVEMLIDSGANVNASDVDGYTPLHRAVQSGDVRIVEAIIDAGASRSAVTTSGDTPCSLARANGFTEIESLLSKKDKRNADRQQ